MGLMVTGPASPWCTTAATCIGYHSDMMWLPEHGVGAVVLTNSDPGWIIRSLFRRKLLEVLFDAKPRAEAEVAAGARSYYEGLAARRTLLDVPVVADVAAGLAPAYQQRRAR